MSLSLTVLTLLHVAISLVGIVSGLVVAAGMLAAKRFDRWTSLFLATTVATTVTGFFFPFNGFLPSHGVGIVSLVVLPWAIYARYRRSLSGWWRPTFVVASMIALYLNVFVLVVQLFLKVPALYTLAPHQTEPPFQISQLFVLASFVAWTVAAVVRFRVNLAPALAEPAGRA